MGILGKGKKSEPKWDTQEIINAIENAKSIVEVDLIAERISITLRVINSRTFKGGPKVQKQLMKDLMRIGGICDAKLDEFSGLTSVANYTLENSWNDKGSPIIMPKQDGKIIIN